jgi:DNA invertase Pin-like site-specific DNA recombinase
VKQTAIYVRVSSRSQDHRAQEIDLKRWASSCDTPVRWVYDTFSGRTMDRPGWSQLQGAIELGEIGTVVVWRLDRLGRTAKGLVTLFEELHNRGVGLISLKDGLDFSTAAGRLMANVLASVAAFETEVRCERQRAGIEAARAAGARWGGSLKGRRLKVTPEQVATITRLKSEKTPVAAIARATGLSRPTVYSILAQSDRSDVRPNADARADAVLVVTQKGCLGP